jgi:hypothetical protein
MGNGRRLERRSSRSWLTEFAAWAIFTKHSCANIRSFIRVYALARCVCILLQIINRALIQFRGRGSNNRREIRSRARSLRHFVRKQLGHVCTLSQAVPSRIYHPDTLIYLVIIPILVPREAPCNLQRVLRTVSSDQKRFLRVTRNFDIFLSPDLSQDGW